MVDDVTIPGAVVGEHCRQHLGDPMGEQRALAAGEAVAVLGDRRVVAVDGEDRLSWLDSLSSQALTTLPVGASTELLLLDPHGHVLHAAAVLDDGTTTWLITDAAAAEGLLDWLVKMRFRLRVSPRAVEGIAVIGGTRAAVTALAGGGPIWIDPWPGVSVGGHGYATGDGHPGAHRDWAEAVIDARTEHELVVAARDGRVRLAGLDAAEALRIAAWRPRASGDVDDRTLPHELDWMRTAVHLNKGCYRGQETVAKVHNLGHPPRRFVFLQLDGSKSLLPEPGAVVRHGDREVGIVTSVARHYQEGPIALAVIKRTAPVEDALTVDTAEGVVAAAQEVIVPADAGAAAGVPRLTRLSRRPAAT